MGKIYDFIYKNFINPIKTQWDIFGKNNIKNATEEAGKTILEEIDKRQFDINDVKDILNGEKDILTGETIKKTPSETPGETPSGTPGETIPDETNKNMEYPIGQDWQNYLEKMQERQWEREDAIRRETQMREDTAYQRARADAEKAGINLNLTGISPASSGGGITQATGMNYSPYGTNIDEALKKWETILENNTEISENEKERLSGILGEILQIVLLTKLTGKK